MRAFAGGDAIVVLGNLRPVEVPATPAHPFADAPRDRTAEALRVCTYDTTFLGTRYRTVDNPGGSPYWDAGSGPLVIGTEAGTGRLGVKYRADGVLLAEADFALTIAAATQARLTSAAGGPLVTAQLGQRTTDSGLTLAVGYSRNRGIPEHWGWVANSVGGTRYVGPAQYGDITSATLSVPAGGGTLELLDGGGRSCTAESRSCTLTLDKAALQAAARYGLPAAKAAVGVEGR